MMALFRTLTGLMVGGLFLAGCSNPSDIGVMEIGPIGEDTTLAQARLDAPYPIRLPAYRPQGVGDVARVSKLGAGPSMQVAIEWEDGTRLVILPFEEQPDYSRVPMFSGGGELTTVRDGQAAYVREPTRNKHQGLLQSFLRWYEAPVGIEYTLIGPHATEDLIAMAESMPI